MTPREHPHASMATSPMPPFPAIAEKAGNGPVIATQGLAKSYGRITALRDLTLTVPRGEVFGFLGPNGAGKTTAIKLLLGLTRPSSGTGTVLGAPLGTVGVRSRLGYLPELFRYQDWLSATEILTLHSRLAQRPRPARAREISDALDLVGLTARAGHRVGTFSKGMQQRLGLAVALLGQPDLVFLDEPTSALDPVGRHDVRSIIHALKARGTSVFLNSHLLTEVEHVCDRVAIIDKGCVIASGTLAELTHQTPLVRLRLGQTSSDTMRSLARFGVVSSEHDGWLTVHGVGAADVPDLINQLVRDGAHIYAVEPQQQSLEEVFLGFLGVQERPARDKETKQS